MKPRTTRAAERATRVVAALKAHMPEPRCELDYQNPFQLLVATILSAQTTDRAVNAATPALFARYPDARALAAAAPEDVEALVRSTGFYRTKARHIRETARVLAAEHDGEVPRTVEALTKLPGVARKTANVVLGQAFGIPSGIAVDTHVNRVSRRLGLTRHEDPVKIERDLMALVPRDEWIGTNGRLVLHGRYVCTARAPRCDVCPCRAFCPSSQG